MQDDLSHARLKLNVRDGHVLIGSDAHYRKGYVSTAHSGFLSFIHQFQPQAVIANGDMFNGDAVSSHARIGWEDRPSVAEEIETTQARMAEIAAACKARHIWTLGNHDARFNTRLAALVPEYENVQGFHLKDHFPDWEPAMSVWINDNVVVKHRFKGGVNAAFNNAMASGKTMVTGHLHSQKVIPVSDYNGTRWGVDTGTMADPYGPQFTAYTEDAPLDWRSGFSLLTFLDGELLPPELITVWRKGVVAFRGQLFEV